MRDRLIDNTRSDHLCRQCGTPDDTIETSSRTTHLTPEEHSCLNTTAKKYAAPDMKRFHYLFNDSRLTNQEIEECIQSISLVTESFVELIYGVHPAQGALTTHSAQDEMQKIVKETFSPYHVLK